MMEWKVNLLNTKKATACGTFPPKILEISSEASVYIVHNLFNEILTRQMLLLTNCLSMFEHFVGLTLQWLKRVKNLADITPAFKKKNPLNKVNCRPVIVLLSISKKFEKLMQKQISDYISNYLLHTCAGIRKVSIHNKLYCHSLKTVKTF